MRKSFLFLAVALAMCRLAAVDPGGLSEDSRNDFLRKALWIDVGSQTRTASVANAYNVGHGVSMAAGYGSSESFVVWTPYRGAFPIGRADFFQTVGEADIAREVRAFEDERARDGKTATALCWAAGVATGVGLVELFWPMVFDDHGDEAMRSMAERNMYAGAGLTLGGCLLFCVAVPFGLRSERVQDISAEFAMGLADSYNRRLLESLRGM